MSPEPMDEDEDDSLSSTHDTTTFPLLLNKPLAEEDKFLYQFLNLNNEQQQRSSSIPADSRQSFKYNVVHHRLPQKRRSLPEILLYLAQKVQNPKNTNYAAANKRVTNEIIINVEDFDEMEKNKNLNVGLKGSLDLPG
jgi:hypothetical protein